MTSDITWGPEIRVDGKRPEWLRDGPQPMLLHNEVGWHTWRVSQVDPALVAWSFNDHRPNVDLIRLPADHPHYAAHITATAPSGGEVGPEVVAKVREAIRQALQCTPTINPYRGVIEYDCGDPWAILREALALLPEPVDADEAEATALSRQWGGVDQPAMLAAIKRGRALAAGDRL